MKSKYQFTVHIYYGGEMPNETWFTDTIDEARDLAKKGEHSEILNQQGIFIQ